MGLNMKLLFPQPTRCAFCSRTVGRLVHDMPQGVALCALCYEEVGWITAPRCEQCGRQLDAHDSVAKEGVYCDDCSRFRHLFTQTGLVKNRAVVAYSQLAQDVISIFKYRGRETLARPCGKLMARLVQDEYRGETIRAVTFVPLHPRREAERGFNQAERLAKVIGSELRLPVYPVLQRTKDTSKQSKRPRHGRLSAMTAAFSTRISVERNFYRQGTFLLVDDVYTTGTTLRACARVLTEAGVSRVLAVTFAR